MNIDSIKLLTARVLRESPQLRTIDMREEVWRKVLIACPSAKFSTVERSIRWFQNTKEMYLPEEDDGRYVYQEVYKEAFS